MKEFTCVNSAKARAIASREICLGCLISADHIFSKKMKEAGTKIIAAIPYGKVPIHMKYQ